MKKNYLEILISFLSGASWAFVVIGAVNLFWLFLPFGFFSALIAGFIGSLFGLFMVFIIEIGAIQLKKLEELKYQTKLLEKIAKKDNDILSDN